MLYLFNMRGPVLSPDFSRSPQPNVVPREPIPFAATPEIRKKNDAVVRAGFFDNEGRARMEKSACGGAYSELKQMCGDPKTWKDEDMNRPEIQALVMANRTFGVLRDRKPLIADEVEILNLLLNRQQEINMQKMDALNKDANIQAIMASSGMGGKIEAEVVQNQAEINLIHKAMEQGISTIDERTAQGTNGLKSSWAEPGKDMNAALTANVVKLYNHTLQMTDTEWKNVKFPTEPLRRPMTPEEQAALADQVKAFEAADVARKAQQLKGDEKEDEEKTPTPKLTVVPKNQVEISPEEALLKEKLLKLAA